VRALVLAAALLLAAAPALADGFFSRAPEPAQVVDSISWTGLHDLSAADVNGHLFTQARPRWRLFSPRPEYDPTTLESDMQRVVDACREQGYYLARASYTLEWREDGHAVRITIHVDEGPPVRLYAWGVDLSELPGGDARWRARLLHDFPLHDGAVFRVADYGKAKQQLLDGLADEGFPDASLTGGGEVDVARRTAVVWWRVHPGAFVRFGEIRVEGLASVDESLVRRELAIAPGEPWSREKLQLSQDQIADLGVFRSVTLVPLTQDGSRDVEADRRRSATLTPDTTLSRPILVELDERPLRSVRIGLGVGTVDKVRVQAAWIHRNVFGRADPLEVGGSASALTREFAATLREPRIPVHDTNVVLRARLSNETVPAYDATELAGRAGVEWPLGPGWSGFAGYAFEHVRVTDVTGAANRAFDNPEQTMNLGHLDLALRFISTDDLFDPRRGIWSELSLEPGARFLGGDLDYAKATFDTRGYLPLGPTVLAGRVAVGTIDAVGGAATDELPITKLYYAGGSGTVRGYGYQRLGTVDDEGKAIGGASELLASAELRVPLWKRFPDLGGVVFLDAGELSHRSYDWKPGKLRCSPGFGLRYATPIGPVRFDVGFPVNAPSRVQGHRIWLSVGQAF
jgi:translocation and assembly module TamA